VRWVKTLLLMLTFFLAILFSIQNQSQVTLHFALFPMEHFQWFEIPPTPVPLFLVVLCSIFLGILIGGIGDLYQRFQIKKILRQSQKTIERLEKEIQSLRGPGLDQSSFLKKNG
jgi:uncharacterized integral membrane protein